MPDLEASQTPVSPHQGESSGGSLSLSQRSAGDGLPVMVLAGDADESSAPQIDRFFDELNASKPRHMLLDLQELEFAGESFLSSLLYWREALRNRQGRLALFGLRPEIASTLRMRALDRILLVCEDEAEALASLG